MSECFYSQSDQDSLCFHGPPLGGVVMCQTWTGCVLFNRRIFLCLALGTWSDMLEPARLPLMMHVYTECSVLDFKCYWGLDSRVAPTFILFVWPCWCLEATDGRQLCPPVSFTFILLTFGSTLASKLREIARTTSWTKRILLPGNFMGINKMERLFWMK